MNDYHLNETYFWIVLSHKPTMICWYYLYLYSSISYLSEYIFTCFRFEGIFDFVEWFLVQLARSKTYRREYDTRIPSRTEERANRIPIRQIEKQFQCHACVRVRACMYVCLQKILIINSLHQTNFISMNVIDFLSCINDFWSDEVKLICAATVFLFWSFNFIRYCYLSVEAVRFTNFKITLILSLFVQT